MLQDDEESKKIHDDAHSPQGQEDVGNLRSEPLAIFGYVEHAGVARADDITAEIENLRVVRPQEEGEVPPISPVSQSINTVTASSSNRASHLCQRFDVAYKW